MISLEQQIKFNNTPQETPIITDKPQAKPLKARSHDARIHPQMPFYGRDIFL